MKIYLKKYFSLFLSKIKTFINPTEMIDENKSIHSESLELENKDSVQTEVIDENVSVHSENLETENKDSVQIPEESSVIQNEDKEESREIKDSIKEQEDEEFVRISTYTKNDSYLLIGASLRGNSHFSKGIECQDYHLYEALNEDWHILVVSDGAGTARLAARGSKGNCNVLKVLLEQCIKEKKWAESKTLPSELEWYIEIRSIFEQMKLIYRNKASQEDETKESDFNATILVAVITPYGVLTAHIGDGRMGYLYNGTWKHIMKPHKGEEASQTIFLQSPWTLPRVPALQLNGAYVPEINIINEIPDAIVLMSDGCEHTAWECSVYSPSTGRYEDKNVPYPGFMNPLIESIISEPEDSRLKLFIDILDKGTKSLETERDDKTMLLAINLHKYDL